MSMYCLQPIQQSQHDTHTIDSKYLSCSVLSFFSTICLLLIYFFSVLSLSLSVTSIPSYPSYVLSPYLPFPIASGNSSVWSLITTSPVGLKGRTVWSWRVTLMPGPTCPVTLPTAASVKWMPSPLLPLESAGERHR